MTPTPFTQKNVDDLVKMVEAIEQFSREMNVPLVIAARMMLTSMRIMAERNVNDTMAALANMPARETKQ